VLVREQIQSIGANLVTVLPAERRAGGIGRGRDAAALTYEDAQAIANGGGVTKAAAVSPELSNSFQLVAGANNTATQVSGVTADYLSVNNVAVERGEFISRGQVMAAANVVVLGPALAKTLFDEREPVGKEIKINRLSFQVIGVLKTKGGGGFGSPDEFALVPLTTMHARLVGKPPGGGGSPGRPVSYISIQAVDEQSIEPLIVEVTEVLRQRHRIGRGEDDFRIFNQADMLQSTGRITGFITAFLGVVAGISLLVGGIGIMNIMLVSVTERTREIGIRKAVGARRRDILGQFLVESVALSLVGCAIGILVGIGAAQLANLMQLRPVVDVSAILLAVGVSVGIGLFFGIWPARRAARLNPIDALRYE
jgi:putative ABC transport system permease protein